MDRTWLEWHLPTLLGVYFFELVAGDPSALLGIVLGAAAVDGPDVGEVLILGEGEADVQEDAVDLRVEFYPEKCHALQL